MPNMPLPPFSDIVTVLVVVILAFNNFFSGRRKDKKDDIAIETGAMQLLRGTVNTYRDEVDKLKTELHEQGKQLERFKGVIEEKDKQLLMFERIFQGRDPDADKFKSTMLASVEADAEYRKNTATLFNEMVSTLKSLHNHVTNGKVKHE